ncbi:hypothetical protein [Janibacter melonis]|uniref:hypothetical protein n=1 Tax=Janibacter melonis TaxID=262209 RepID=UPI00191979C5|nr:hypothetical protein [Janibacter melonis]
MSAGRPAPRPSRAARWIAEHYTGFVAGLAVIALLIVALTVAAAIADGLGNWWLLGNLFSCLAGFLGARDARRNVAEYDAAHLGQERVSDANPHP